MGAEKCNVLSLTEYGEQDECEPHGKHAAARCATEGLAGVRARRPAESSPPARRSAASDHSQRTYSMTLHYHIKLLTFTNMIYRNLINS